MAEEAQRKLRKLEDRLDDLEESHDRHKEAARDTAKLLTYTSRDVERLAGKVDLAVYANGDLKTKLKDKYDDYKKNAKKGDKRAGAQAPGVASGSGTAAAKAPPPPPPAQPALAAAADAAMPPQAPQGLEGMGPLSDALPPAEYPTWKVVFTRTLLDYLKAKVVTEGPPEQQSSAKLQEAVNKCSLVVPAEATVFQRFHTLEPPDGKPWVSDLSLDGGVQGSELYSLLVHEFKGLYVRDGDVSVKPRGSNKDRPLAAKVAEYGGVRVRTGQRDRPDQRSAAGDKRPSQERRGGRADKRSKKH